MAVEQQIQKVAIVGAGAMGRGIAQICAVAGCDVQLFDAAPEAVTRAIDAIREDLSKAVSRGRTSHADADGALGRIAPAGHLNDLSDCDLVVEAIVEQLGPKQSLFRDLEGVVKKSCILATNTSSLSVTAIASSCREPRRVAGWHFFNPVPRMKLVEVIQTPLTSPDSIHALVELSQRAGHRAVLASDSPGFVVNHAGRAFVTEGLKLLAERTAEHDVLDAILRTCAGFRMGPFELLDLMGLDVSVPVMESIHAQYYGDDRYRPVALARTRLLAGLLGRKSGRGFYDYQAEKAPANIDKQDVASAASVDTSLWWPTEGVAALPPSITELLPWAGRKSAPDSADLILLAPIQADLTSTVSALRLDPSKTLGVDPVFGGSAGVTLMTSPATSAAAIETAKALFAARSVPVFVIADSPGFVAPRIVACIVNLACELAQQGIASPADIDTAVRLGLGYPLGPFEWGDRLGASLVLQILEALQATFGDQRYRPSPWLIRRAQLSLPLSTPDLAPHS